MGNLLVKHKPMPCIPIDALRVAIRTGIPKAGLKIETTLIAEARSMQPVVRQLCNNLRLAWDNAAVEGADILPKQVARMQRKDVDSVQAVFLGWSEIDEAKLMKFEGANTWLSEEDDASRKLTVRRLLRDSRYIELECKKYEIPFVDMAAGPYKQQQRLALSLLLENA